MIRETFTCDCCEGTCTVRIPDECDGDYTVAFCPLCGAPHSSDDDADE
jgi:hypothetical protein